MSMQFYYTLLRLFLTLWCKMLVWYIRLWDIAKWSNHVKMRTKKLSAFFFFSFFNIILVFYLFVVLYLRFSRHLIFGIAKQLMNFDHVSPFCLSWLMLFLLYLIYNSQMLFLIPVSFWSVCLVIDLIFNFQNRSSWWIYTTRWPQRRGLGRMWEGDNYQIDTGMGEYNSPRIYLQKQSPRRWS